MRAVVTQPTRIIGDNSYSVHPGDILEGADAALQVAAGNAEVLDEAVPVEPEAESVAADEAVEAEAAPEEPIEAPDVAAPVEQPLTDAYKESLGKSYK